MRKFQLFRGFAIVALVCFASIPTIYADVVNSADVVGFETFMDTNTGRIWLDLDNFFDDAANYGESGYDMISNAELAGFTFATSADLHELLDTLPLTGGEWSTYAPIMGYGIPRQLIWGMFDDGNGNPYGYAWAFGPNSGVQDTIWNYQYDATDANNIQNEGIPGAVDMGIWAYQESNTVPEPTSLILLGTGLGALGLLSRGKK